MKRILIAFDGSPGAEVAVQDLIRAGLPNRAEAKVLTIADVWMPPAPKGDVDIFSTHAKVADAYEKATELLREAKKISIQGSQFVHQLFPEWTITNFTAADSPAWGIVAEARKWRADLIVIGSHGRTTLERFFLGSVSFKVAAEAPCSVRVVRPRADSATLPLHLMVCLDGSDESIHAVDEISQRQWPAGTKVEFVSVIDPKLRSQLLARNRPFGDPVAFEKFEDAIQLALETAQRKLSPQELTAQCHILEGDPKQVLLHQAAHWKVDCIFLGARGLERGDRLYLGTLASAVCTRAHCTVEIIRQPK
ncbi:MAG TPA: universal stress protein [Verrucomicrobiae bacterium]|nr:universal stress protein [Verrucomicrobiae bacterium]